MKNVVLIFICLLLFTTCKRYPDGGWHYRLFKNLAGKWKLTRYEVDRIDSTYLTQGYQYIPNYLEDFMSIATVHTGNRTEMNVNSHSVHYSVYVNKKRRNFIQFYSGNTGAQVKKRNILAPRDQYFNWEIIRCTKKELILKSELYNYKLILNK